MASTISNVKLLEKARRFITSDAKDKILDMVIKEAIISADRELHEADSLSPLAWDIQSYDELRTNIYAEISAITADNPGVITAASADSDVTGHGFSNHATIRDIVVIDNLDGMERLNGRGFLLEYASATTFSLKSLDGLTAINTTNFDAYSSGGIVYHAGFVLNTTTILADVDSQWTIKQLLPSPTFDGYPTDPISEQVARNTRAWTSPSAAQRPSRYRYWQQITNPHTPTVSHYLFWYPPCNQAYNVMIPYQREVPDISTWTAAAYPFHPPEAHDAIWHGALAGLAGESQRMKRSSDKVIATQVEVMFAQKWIAQWIRDKAHVVNLSRKMLGSSGGMGGFTA